MASSKQGPPEAGEPTAERGEAFMSVVMQMSDWPRPQVREPHKPQIRREQLAEIHILPCIRREPLQGRGARFARLEEAS